MAKTRIGKTPPDTRKIGGKTFKAGGGVWFGYSVGKELAAYRKRGFMARKVKAAGWATGKGDPLYSIYIRRKK